MLRILERPTAESNKATEPEKTIQAERVELIRAQKPLGRITVAQHNLSELISRRGSPSWIKEKMAGMESVWKKCRQLDKVVQEINGKYNSKEAFSEEDQRQSEYEEKMRPAP